MRTWMKANGFVAGLTVALLFSLTGNVLGADGLTDISAFLNTRIKVVLHGQAFEPIEPTDGTRMVPITYKGRTYLPLRAVAEAVGLQVTWDPNTETAYLGNVSGTIEKKISYIAASPEYASTDSEYILKTRQPEKLMYDGGKAFDTGYLPTGAGIYVTFNTNFAYDKFKATFWVDDTERLEDEAEIEFRDEHDILVKEFKVKYGQVFEVELDIKDVDQLNVWVRGDKSIIGNPMLGK